MKRSRRFPEHSTPMPDVAAALAALAILILAQIAAPAPAVAQELISRFGVTGQAGGGLMSMSDANDRIEVANEFLESKGWKTLSDLGLGFSFTGDVRYRVAGPFWLTAGGGYTFGQSGVDFDEVITIRPSGSVYHLRALYDIPFRPRPKMLLRVGGGPVYMPNAEFKVEHENRSPDVQGQTERIETLYFEGKGWGGAGLLEAEYLLTQKASLVVDLGYRYLKVDRDKIRWSIPRLPGNTLPDQDEDGDGVVNRYDLDEENGIIANAFLEIQRNLGGEPIIDGEGRPLTEPRGLEKIDFSGPQLNVGLRYYIF